MSSEERFGYQWNKYSWMTPVYEKQFRNWTHPMAPEDWKGKKVLDVGSGMGRNSYWPLKWGAASVTAFDYDKRSVARTRETLREFLNADVQYKSVYDIDWSNEYDTAFSIGVIHHLDNPKKALERMVAALKPGGTLLIWVYSYEGNEWIVRFVDPVRKNITSTLPLPVVHMLAYCCTVPLYVLVKILHGPSAYLKQLSTFDFWHVQNIVFDQLIPRVANYWKRDEVRELVDGLMVKNVTVEQTPQGTGWILTATKV